MRAGPLRDTITIQRRPDEADYLGIRSDPWIMVLENVPAHVQEISGTEATAPNAMVSTMQIVILIRGFPGWRDVIRPDYRAVFGSRIFDIKTIINPDGRDRDLQLFVYDIVA